MGDVDLTPEELTEFGQKLSCAKKKSLEIAEEVLDVDVDVEDEPQVENMSKLKKPKQCWTK